MTGAETVFAYHTRTKHRVQRYAAGPETLDWDAQPNPFREFSGSPRIQLPLSAHLLTVDFADLFRPGVLPPAPLSLATLGTLLELSLGVSAWKELGPDRWALRCNPSSGNLHPTEAYIIARNLVGLEDGLYHYLSRDHVLEQRCKMPPSDGTGLWIGLSSVHWREAWKYGERAFRYCQLDTGHALGALRIAAATLGWTAKCVSTRDSTALSALMGLDRAEDFHGVEPEDSEALLTLTAAAPPPVNGTWHGRANRLDPHPLYRWPIINDVANATKGLAQSPPTAPTPYPPFAQPEGANAARLILNRRSAQRFDSRFTMRQETFHHMLDSLLPRATPPWDVWDHAPGLHPIIFVHRVEGLSPGLYALPRHPAAETLMRATLRPDFLWEKSANTPDHLPLFQLLAADTRSAARALNCHQAIAAESCFSLAMLSEFAAIVRPNPFRYRQLYWEAGLLGQALYLQAEAVGLRGTGIGCFLDDTLHELLGIQGDALQSLYHFTVGRPLADSRITTLPAYPGRPEEQPQ